MSIKNIKIKSSQSAFSLIEVIVSVALFAIIMLTTTQIFKLAVDSQRSALASQNVQESLKYFLEMTAKEMRMAKPNEALCPGILPDKIYATSSNSFGDILQFRNYYDECVVYQLVDDNGVKRFQIARASESDFVSPRKINMDKLRFVVLDASSTQASVTIGLEASALSQAQFKSELQIQTTLTSRYYKN